MGDWKYVLEIGGGAIDLPPGESTIGRSRTSAVRIDDESVSRSHAAIVCGDGKAKLRDLGSSNGTFIGDRRVAREMVVLHGAVLRFGNILARFEVISGTPSDDEKTVPEIVCGACGIWNLADQGLCSNCGTPLPGARPRCRACGHELTAESRFCNACGEPVRSGQVAVPPPPRTESISPERPTRMIAAPSPGPASPADIDLPLRSVPLEIAGADRPRPPEGSPAPLGARLAAASVDALVILAMELFFLLPAAILFAVHRTVGEAGLGRPRQGLAIIVGTLVVGALALAVFWLAAGWARRGSTFGERLLHLEVAAAGVTPGEGLGWRRGTRRALVALAGSLLLGFGVLPVLFRRRPLHDVVSGTRLVVAPRG